ncbi:hypothetical protein SAMN05428988_0134 [Chitinophaga sp. YR573]|uniref:hypothetical protein n=1 Tax=Chitinophaga sp. YR573 TaxID=1881040 RepID=UPI0008C2718E|nr:hypothetical protein [Chitinophaga sp. YR573]SEV88694.1 hypothetical protein SAMN05428988_0134 [Chitinophaga sp. YR573]
MNDLTKENFWNKCFEKYPDATQEFCEWIDGYKASVDWEELFVSGIKFHDIPGEMQCGIWIEFVISQGACSYEVDWIETELGEEIMEYMKQRQYQIIDES